MKIENNKRTHVHAHTDAQHAVVSANDNRPRRTIHDKNIRSQVLPCEWMGNRDKNLNKPSNDNNENFTNK